MQSEAFVKSFISMTDLCRCVLVSGVKHILSACVLNVCYWLSELGECGHQDQPPDIEILVKCA